MTGARTDTALTSRYSSAVEYARRAHADQVRKGTHISYIQHPLAVSALVIGYGGDEDEAIAALLHDVIEDCGSVHERVIRGCFGDRVTSIVLDCTDANAETKNAVPAAEREAAWWARKRAYIAALPGKSDSVLLVSACDKLHNVGSIIDELLDPKIGARVFDRFKVGQDATLCYYMALVPIYVERRVAAAPALARAVEAMHAQVGVDWRREPK